MKRLRELREKHNLTQTQLAQNLKIPRYTYCRIENDFTEADYATLEKIAKYFQVSIDYLLQNSNNPLPPDIVDTLNSLEDLEKTEIARQVLQLPSDKANLVKEYINLLKKS